MLSLKWLTIPPSVTHPFRVKPQPAGLYQPRLQYCCTAGSMPSSESDNNRRTAREGATDHLLLVIFFLYLTVARTKKYNKAYLEFDF